VARGKQVLHQVDFSGGQVREDLIERDDTDLFNRSLKRAENVRILSTGALSSRPGTFFVRELTATAEDIYEVSPADGETFALILNDSSLEIIDSTGRVVRTFASVAWTDATGLWVEPRAELTLIGGDGIAPQALLYEDGVWTLGALNFEEAPGGTLAQPYWAYAAGISIQPSARSGTINLTASSAVFASTDVGQRIRYADKEVEITAYVSPTLVSGTVVTKLPPTFFITVSTVDGFAVGEAVVGADTGFQGVITAISNSTLTVLALNDFGGPLLSETLVGPSQRSAITNKSETTPAATTVWDEPLMSPKRGYPRSASSVAGRLVFADFPNAPNVVALSSSRGVTDFETGTDDDDAIVRSIGNNSPRIKHVISAFDLVLLTDRGAYYVQTRGGQVLTPSAFTATLFDERGANGVAPIRVDDGIAYIDTSGQRVLVARLDGNVQLTWSVTAASDLYSDLVTAPKKLCASALDNGSPEKYVFVVNDDGTLAAVSWGERFNSEGVGMVPWTTSGSFVNVAPVFSDHWCIVDRTIDGVTVRYLERFSNDAYLDAAVEAESDPTEGVLVTDDSEELQTLAGEALLVQDGPLSHLAGETIRFWSADKYLGEYAVNADGTVTTPPAATGARQMGIGFTTTIEPWPRTYINDRYKGLRQARTIRVGVGVQNTVYYAFRRNGVTSDFGPYLSFEDVTQSPQRKDRDAKYSVLGKRDKPQVEVIRDQPGPFTLTRLTMEVQA
jgi:hypothetical protein